MIYTERKGYVNFNIKSVLFVSILWENLQNTLETLSNLEDQLVCAVVHEHVCYSSLSGQWWVSISFIALTCTEWLLLLDYCTVECEINGNNNNNTNNNNTLHWPYSHYGIWWFSQLTYMFVNGLIVRRSQRVQRLQCCTASCYSSGLICGRGLNHNV
jgi:hypothetical protein